MRSTFMSAQFLSRFFLVVVFGLLSVGCFVEGRAEARILGGIFGLLALYSGGSCLSNFCSTVRLAGKKSEGN